MSPEERDPGLLSDMVIAARKVVRYTDDVALEQFLGDDMMQNAVLHLLMIIGEAANRVSPATKTAIDLPWAKIIGQRHVVVHDYRRLDLNRIWQTTRTFLPPLVAAIERHLTEHP